MKRSIPFIMVLFCFFFLYSPVLHAKKHQIYGLWKPAVGKNSENNARLLGNRIQVFNPDNTFESKIHTDKGFVSANGGKFYLVNDSTFVTYHKDLLGNLESISNSYTFHIKNDTLHFYGFYLRQLPQNPSFLLKVPINEWWVKSNKQ